MASMKASISMRSWRKHGPRREARLVQPRHQRAARAAAFLARALGAICRGALLRTFATRQSTSRSIPGWQDRCAADWVFSGCDRTT